MGSCASRACRQTTSGAMLAFAVLVSSHRFINCTPTASNLVSILLEIVEILQIDLQHHDDNIEVHFLSGRVPLLGECLAASFLL